jgi:hypothetical protein
MLIVAYVDLNFPGIQHFQNHLNRDCSSTAQVEKGQLLRNEVGLLFTPRASDLAINTNHGLNSNTLFGDTYLSV